MEGFLSPGWSIFWYAVSFPFILMGLNVINKLIHQNPQIKLHLAVAGAFTFLLSALKIPSVAGSSSHPTGIGFGTILFGPSVMAVIGVIVLLFQALFLAHGGLTTLGANVFSMAIAGPWAGFILFKVFQTIKAPLWLSVFICAFVSDIFTYIITSLQLSLAYMNQSSGFMETFEKFIGVFAVTQVPLAIFEGIATYLIFNFIGKVNRQSLNFFSVEEKRNFNENF
jgi:cobalt/nickel transport system permease protein